jgi:hypothetical protein
MTRDSINSAPTEATRAKHFAAFFKTYMSISTVVVASLPIPVASLHLVKTYSAQTKLFSVYTSLFCFLILGFIFFSRHALGRVLFVNETGGKRFVSSLPLLLIFGSIVMMFLYQSLLSDSLTVAKARGQAIAEGGEMSSAYLYDLEHADSEDAELALSSGFLSDRDIFVSSEPSTLDALAVAVATRHKMHQWDTATGQAAQDFYSHHIPTVAYVGNLNSAAPDPLNVSLEAIPWGIRLTAYYLGIFAFAEAAFVLMALKEYLLDLLHLSDISLITGANDSVQDKAEAVSV